MLYAETSYFIFGGPYLLACDMKIADKLLFCFIMWKNMFIVWYMCNVRGLFEFWSHCAQIVL